MTAVIRDISCVFVDRISVGFSFILGVAITLRNVNPLDDPSAKKLACYFGV
jgi:hypothetical protein